VAAPKLETTRLRLRRWTQRDEEPFAVMNADPRVMEHFPSPLTRAESDALVARIQAEFEERRFSFWAVEILNVAPFAGFIGLSVPQFSTHFTPCVEIGWRLAAEYWNHGYATEGARAAVVFGFDVLKLDEIVAFTTPGNIRSRRVMEKIGMTHDPADDFDHPLVPEGHRLRPHVLYRLKRQPRSKADLIGYSMGFQQIQGVGVPGSRADRRLHPM
jgi:RimJ/RimL family protein N-acetyltransferase